MKRLILPFLLVLLIILFVYFNVFDLFVGPYKAKDYATSNTIKLFEKNSDESVKRLLNRFSLDQVYTLVLVEDEIVVLLADGQVYLRENYQELPTFANQYGVYQNEVVFVHQSETQEIYYDMTTQHVLFEMEWGK